MKLAALTISLLVMGSGAFAKSEKVKFSKDDLAKETVLPVFREKVAVKNRNVEMGKRMAFSAMGGSTLNDAMFDVVSAGVGFNYHFSNQHSVYVEFISHTSAESKFVSEVENATGNTSDFSLSSALSSQYTASWEYEPFYGKLSFAKSVVYNMSTYVTGGVGVINYTNGSSTLLQGGIGQKVFFTKNWGLRFDLRTMFYQQPNIVAQARSSSAADEAAFNILLTAGVVFLFPTL